MQALHIYYKICITMNMLNVSFHAPGILVCCVWVWRQVINTNMQPFNQTIKMVGTHQRIVATHITAANI